MFKAVATMIVLVCATRAALGAAQTPKPKDMEIKDGAVGSSPSSKRSLNMPLSTPNRSIYMNGVDISSSRNQDLRNVHVKISDNGDIYIAAPQYQVTEEETFLPLSTYTKAKTPEHKPAQPMNSASGKAAAKTAAAAIEPKPDAPAKPASAVAPAESVVPGKTGPAEAAAEIDPASKSENTK
jgi:hypothetical protein